MAGYNLIVKADTIEAATRHVTEYLSIPTKSASPLGYGEVMVTVESDTDLQAPLHHWLVDSRPYDSAPFPPGALIWWKGDAP